ncbi:unnamed protein product [Calicophoron daubneyi]|uniref:Proteasome maturation factor UMP1 n=1 Tax=Calicophoron daubneyi TaxID=300641 RepID=A0AAV2T1S2_CALDB
MHSEQMLSAEFGVRPVMYTGLGNKSHRTIWSSSDACALSSLGDPKAIDSVEFPHPVAEIIARRGKGADEAKRMKVLAAVEGIHVPMRLAMEKRIMRRIQPRLPGLYSYHPLAAQLDGSLDDVDVTDFLNAAEDAETVGTPHLLMERRLNIL